MKQITKGARLSNTLDDATHQLTTTTSASLIPGASSCKKCEVTNYQEIPGSKLQCLAESQDVSAVCWSLLRTHPLVVSCRILVDVVPDFVGLQQLQGQQGQLLALQVPLQVHRGVHPLQLTQRNGD